MAVAHVVTGPEREGGWPKVTQRSGRCGGGESRNLGRMGLEPEELGTAASQWEQSALEGPKGGLGQGSRLQGGNGPELVARAVSGCILGAKP